MNNLIENRMAGFRAPSTFHEKVRAFCEANDMTPSQVFRRATLLYIDGVLSGGKSFCSAKTRILQNAE